MSDTVFTAVATITVIALIAVSARVLSQWNNEKRKKQRETKKERVENKKKEGKKYDEFGISEDDDEEENGEVREVQKRFLRAAAYLPAVTDKIAQSELLRLYGLYKMGTVGPPSAEDRPSIFDLKGGAKFDAWKSCPAKDKLTAMQGYVELLENVNVEFSAEGEEQSNGKDLGRGFGLGVSRPKVQEVSNVADGTEITEEEADFTEWQRFAQQNDVESCKYLLKKYPTFLDKTDADSKMCALHWCVDGGADEVLEWLLKEGADVNVQDAEGATALHYACVCGRARAVQRLLEYGADTSIVNDDEETAEELADDEDIRNIIANVER